MKQVIVVRKDLNMRKGKMCAQAAHASMKVITDRLIWDSAHPGSYDPELRTTPEITEWLTGIFTKVVVSVDSEDELVDIYNKAQEAKILSCIIEDCGLTEFHGIPTKTVVAVGPAKSEDIDKITRHLKLL